MSSLYLLDPLRLEDIPEVVAIEEASFANPWSRSAFEHEISNSFSYPVVARTRGEDQSGIAGYCVKWVVDEDLHIQNIAVHPLHQRRGLGRYLLEDAMETGRRTGAQKASLEVRVSNRVAERLYESLGFRRVGKRKGYYSLPPEDANIYEKDLANTTS